jgi:hypothetical protein
MSDIVPSGNGSEPMLALIQRAATDPNFDILKFQSLVDAWRAERATQAHRAFNEAMARAQADMREVPKNASNDYLRARYAKLDPMLQVVLPAAQRYGLTVRFGTQSASQPGFLCVTCIVSLGDHSETTAIEGPILVAGASSQSGRAQMTPIQAVGSTVTYLKRYILGLTFALILSDEQDDDGEALRGRGGPTPPSTPPFQAERDSRPVWTAPSPPAGSPPGASAPPPATTTAETATTAPAGSNGQGNGTKPRRTWTDVLDAFEMATKGAATAVQVYNVLTSDDVTKAKELLKPGMAAKERYDTLVTAAMAKARLLEAQEGPPA